MSTPIGVDLPGRCTSCGCHPDPTVQGHRHPCTPTGRMADLHLARERRDEGMAAAVNAHPSDVEIVDAAIRNACHSGQPFSANDFRHLVTDLEQANVIGARIRAWVAGRRIRNVGYVPSTDPATHAHKIGLYVPTGRAA